MIVRKPELLDYSQVFINNYVPVDISFILKENFLMMQSSVFLNWLFFRLIIPSILLSLHSFIESCIIKMLSFLSIIISFNFIISLMIFIESLLLRDVKGWVFLRLKYKISCSLKSRLKPNFIKITMYHDHLILLSLHHLYEHCGICSVWRLHLCNSCYWCIKNI